MGCHAFTHKISGHRHSNWPISPMKDSQSLSHMSTTATDTDYIKNFCQSNQKKQWERKGQKFKN